MARKLPEVEYYNAVHFDVQVVGLRAAIILVIISRLFISVGFFGPNRQLLESHEVLSLYAFFNGLRTRSIEYLVAG